MCRLQDKERDRWSDLATSKVAESPSVWGGVRYTPVFTEFATSLRTPRATSASIVKPLVSYLNAKP